MSHYMCVCVCVCVCVCCPHEPSTRFRNATAHEYIRPRARAHTHTHTGGCEVSLTSTSAGQRAIETIWKEPRTCTGGESLPSLRYEACEVVRLDKSKVCASPSPTLLLSPPTLPLLSHNVSDCCPLLPPCLSPSPWLPASLIRWSARGCMWEIARAIGRGGVVSVQGGREVRFRADHPPSSPVPTTLPPPCTNTPRCTRAAGNHDRGCDSGVYATGWGACVDVSPES